MKTSTFFVVTFLLTNLLYLCAKSTFHSSNDEAFLECLHIHNSQPSHPISTALYTPDNISYSSVLQFYTRNLRFVEPTTPKPRLIIAASHVSHIQASIICAKSNSMEMRIRSGGHDFEGISYVSEVDFFILDMFNLREINVSIEEETAWVETGATQGEIYYRISEKSNVLAFPGGMCPTVGAGGQISGGGFGNLMRKYGLSADNVVDATLVDSNGNLLNRESMGEDLFWAITGGGGASFGVVLAYKIRLVKVPPIVTFIGVRRTYKENLTDIVYKYLHVADKFNEDLYIKVAIDVVKNDEKTVRGTFLGLFLGDSERLLAIVNEKFPELGLKKTDCVESSFVESIVHWVNFPPNSPTSALLSRVHPSPTRMKRKSDFLKKPISKKGLEFIFEKMMELETPVLKIFPFGGIMNNISTSAKPFPHRAGNVALVDIAMNWNETGIEASDRFINMTRKFYEYLTPFVSKSREAYLNYRDLDLGINHHGPNSYSEAAAFGYKYFKNNFNKLVQIKSKVDPGNFFRNEQSIPVLPLIGSA